MLCIINILTPHSDYLTPLLLSTFLTGNRRTRFIKPLIISKFTIFSSLSATNLHIPFYGVFFLPFLANSINSIGAPLCSIMATLVPSEGEFGSVIIFRSWIESSYSRSTTSKAK
jgi:hypothetical protein